MQPSEVAGLHGLSGMRSRHLMHLPIAVNQRNGVPDGTLGDRGGAIS